MHGLGSSPPWSKHMNKFNQTLAQLTMSPIVLLIVCASHWARIASVPPRVRRAVITPQEDLKIQLSACKYNHGGIRKGNFRMSSKKRHKLKKTFSKLSYTYLSVKVLDSTPASTADQWKAIDTCQ